MDKELFCKKGIKKRDRVVLKRLERRKRVDVILLQQSNREDVKSYQWGLAQARAKNLVAFD